MRKSLPVRTISVLASVFVCGALITAAKPQSTSAPPAFSTLARTAVNELAAHQYDKVFVQFDQMMSAAISDAKLAEIWDQVLAQVGAFQKINSVQTNEASGYHVAIVACAFERASLNIVLSFDASGHIAGLHFTPATSQASTLASWTPPPYADMPKFHENPVTITDGQWHLLGTLTFPNGKDPFPAVLLLAGSGPNDADETIGPNKPFKDLAWGLASAGIAVLRYPKRTHEYGGSSAADPMSFTVRDEYMDDARSAADLLALRPEINSKRIFLAGHSEGGYLAPRIASENPQFAGIIILDGNTRPIEKLVAEQLQYQARLGGPDAAQIEKLIPEAEAQAKVIEDPNLKPGTTVALLTATIPSSYFLDLRSYDPLATIAKLRIPIYVVQGGRDYQVTLTDFANWQKALGTHSDATLKMYPALNHLLMPGTGPSSPAEYSRAGQHVSQDVVHDLAAWIHSGGPVH